MLNFLDDEIIKKKQKRNFIFVVNEACRTQGLKF